MASNGQCKDCGAHTDVIAIVAKTDANVRNNTAAIDRHERRIETLEKDNKAMLELGLSVRVLTEQLANDVIPKLVDHEERVDILERRPGVIAVKAWVFVGATVFTATCGLLLGMWIGG